MIVAKGEPTWWGEVTYWSWELFNAAPGTVALSAVAVVAVALWMGRKR